MLNVAVSEKQRNLLKAAISGLSLLLCMFLTFYFLVFWHTGFIYSYFFFVPVVFMSAWWHRKGVILTFALTLFSVICNYFLVPDLSIVNELVRTSMLMFVSILTSIIFEQKQRTEDKLRDLAKFLSEDPDPVLRIAKDGTVLYFNAAGKSQLSELKVEIGKPAPPQLRRLVADALNSGLRKEAEVEHRNRVFLFTLAPVTETAYVNAYGLDITEHKRSEEELRRAEEKFRTIFDGATDGILAADLKTWRFVYANPRICEITGYPLEELLKLGIDDIHPKKDLLYVIDHFTKQTQGKTNLAKDIPVLRKDEKVVYCDINSSSMRIGEQEYLVGFFRDITERKKAEEKTHGKTRYWLALTRFSKKP